MESSPTALLNFELSHLNFELSALQLSKTLDIPYLEWRAVIGIWLMIILITCAVTELTFLVKNFTRFSEEILTGIIAIFFAYEAIKSIIGVRACRPAHY